MKGTIFRQGERYIVGWYYEGRQHKITRYRGEPMYHEKTAQKCLSLIQGRWEDHLAGRCLFRIEEFTGKGWTDVVEFYEHWLKDVVEPRRKPATVKGYTSYLRKWIRPFFREHPVRLHEIQLDTLNALLNHLKKGGLTGKGAQNVVMALHSMMDYAHRSKRIPELPAFPKKEDYGIVDPTFQWLWENQQLEVIEAIPEIHRPPFLWLKYHYRRPGEACALFKTDYDWINDAFWVRRSISDRQLVDSTKTGKAHYVPCHSKFTDIARQLLKRDPWSPFLFVNPRSRKNAEGGRYTSESLNKLWKRACKKLGVSIRLYHGLKHSSCTQFINEKGGSDSELQMLTDHARLDSVTKYRMVGLQRKRELMERGKVVQLKNYQKTTKN